ncbi:MAG TPA: cytochrome c3 family protein [Candidatus Deferrimicrobiaceae bacterium]|nr:cytochrome c3 family protein [Candidatus Deferrimicrobiaceae bacterium]
MKEMFLSFWDLVLRHRKKLLAIGGVILGILIVINGAFFVSAYFPKSCVACHYMDPFYDQWKTSKHADVSCIKCHAFSPLFITVTTLKYWTGLYNPRPHANVPDRFCLASGCHEGRIEKGEAKLGPITFDHSEHMTKLKRGEKLRCTSCHYSIVQGEHITVDTNVCFLCHFKGISQGQALGGCPGCHGTPSTTVDHSGFTFSHDSYLKIGVQCKQCHLRVAEGEGRVDDSRCFDCHVGRLQQKGDPLALHRTHVTRNAIECLKCHEKIRHGEIELVKTFEVQCDACHKRLHNYQKEMYMGAGARGVADTPSRMFSAQVACDGCHTKSVEVRESGVAFPGEKKLTAERNSCVACHGKHYDRLLDDWIRESRVLVEAMQRIVSSGEAAVGTGPTKSKKLEGARALVADARANLALLKAGRGAHNIEYAYKIVKAGYDQVGAAYKAAGIPGGPPRPAILGSSSAYCMTLCHQRVRPPQDLFFREMEIRFPHALHVQDVGIQCTTCHSPDKHKMRIVTKSECMSCHHESRDIDCGQCHQAHKALYEGKVKPAGVSPVPDVMAQAGLSCTDCHELTKGTQTVLTVKAKCEECHSAEYGSMLLSWKEEITEKENAVAVSLEEAREYLERSKKIGKNVDEDLNLLKGAETNYQIVTNGRGTHNYELSRDLLKSAQSSLDKILKKK